MHQQYFSAQSSRNQDKHSSLRTFSSIPAALTASWFTQATNRRNDASEVQVVPPRLSYDYESDCALQLHGREPHCFAAWPQNFPKPLNNAPAPSMHTARRRNDASEVQVVSARLNYDYESDCALQLHGRELHGSATWPRNCPKPLNNTPALSTHTARRRNDALEVQVVPPRLNYDYESDCALQLHGRKLHGSATWPQNCPKPPNNAPASSLIAFRSRSLPPFQ